MKQRKIIVNHRYIGGKLYHCFDNENYELLELERKVYINENERLQNIIEELEKWLKEWLEEDSKDEFDYAIDDTLRLTLDKLKELKEK